MGRMRASLLQRKIQRRSLIDHWRLWRFAGYSPSGRDVVAGKARRARKSVKVKIPNESGMRSARETQSKLSTSPSGCELKRRHVPVEGVCDDDGSRRAMTYPRVVAGIAVARASGSR